MRKALFLSCDPGRHGSIVHVKDSGVLHVTIGITSSSCKLHAYLKNLLDEDRSLMRVAILERTGGYVPGNSGPGAVKFARHCGMIEQALVCHEFAVYSVAPQSWMQRFASLEGIPYPIGDGDKKQRKAEIKRAVTALYSDVRLKVTLGNADALAMLHVLRDAYISGNVDAFMQLDKTRLQ